MKFNEDLYRIEKANTFSRLTQKIREHQPKRRLISLGIGDVSCPIVEPIINAMHQAVDDQGDRTSFHGYGLYYGLPSLIKTILENDYSGMGFSENEVYISDGTKSDTTSLLELFDKDSKILLADPMYPIYKNGSLALSRNIYYQSLDSDYKMPVPDEPYDIIYICSPNNPIGNAYTYDDLKKWVDYANKNHSVIFFDNVYEQFISSPDVPHSIYEVEGAKSCAIEFRSFSKRASFTGTRCSYYVVPEAISPGINALWKERTINRFNGASYIVQRGAEASYLPESKRLISQNIKKYKENAEYLRNSFLELGHEVIGGVDAPFMWVSTKGMDSWSFCDLYLNELDIVVIPGIIFGSQGDDHVRVSALGLLENSIEAMERVREYVKK